MMYIGTSLGGCLLSLLAGEVSEDEVMFIVTRTDCPDYDKFIGVVKFDSEGRKSEHYYPYNHPAKLGHGLWMQVVPTNDNTTPAVVEAWEKYKMLDNLTK